MKKNRTIAYILGVCAILGVSLSLSACSLDYYKNIVQESVITNEEIESLNINGYYYSQLTDDEKQVYASILRALKEYKTETAFIPVSLESFYRASRAVSNDYPKFYWSGDYKAKNFAGIVNRIEFDVPENVKETEDKIEENVNEILEGIDSNASDYEKVKYFYETIIDNVDYEENPRDQDIRSVFLDKKSVCAGYSRAFLYLCQKSDIPCIYVEGIVNDKDLHAWNEVELDGEYYGVDITWGDPVFEEDTTDWSSNEPISYTYLNVNDTDMFKTHKIDCVIEAISKTQQQFTYPSCRSNKYNYYVQEGAYFDTYNRVEVGNYIGNKFFNSGVKNLEIKFSDKAAFDEAYGDLFSDNKPYIYSILDRYGSTFANASVTYITDKDTNVIAISIN